MEFLFQNSLKDRDVKINFTIMKQGEIRMAEGKATLSLRYGAD